MPGPPPVDVRALVMSGVVNQEKGPDRVGKFFVLFEGTPTGCSGIEGNGRCVALVI